jgi:CHAD domain-containing protein
MTATPEPERQSCAPHGQADAGPDHRMPLNVMFRTIAESIAGDVRTAVSALPEAASRTEVLHDLRVAMRRARSLWWAFRPLLERDTCRTQEAWLKAVASAAGNTRDWDILEEVLQTSKLTPARLAALAPRVSLQRNAVLVESSTTLEHMNIVPQLAAAIDHAAGELLVHDATVEASTFVQARVTLARKQLRKAIREALRRSRGKIVALHDVRKAAKKWRYLLELFAPYLGKQARRNLKQLAKMQKALGQLTDLAASAALIKEHAHELSGALNAPRDIAKVLRRVRRRRRHAIRAARKTLKKQVRGR